MVKKEYPITPVPKPRMTQRDKWLSPPRPCVSRYWEFKDWLRNNKFTIPEEGSHVTFVMPMPISWSAKTKQKMDGKPHQSRPDVDNMLKAICDIYPEDSYIWDIRITKIWRYTGKLIVELMPLFNQEGRYE